MTDFAAVERDYRQSGYAVLRDVLSGNEVAAINALVSEIQDKVQSLPASLAEHLVMERDLPRRNGDDAYTGDTIFILGSPPAFHPDFAALAIHPVITGVARALLQTDAIAYHFSNVTTKRPVGGRAIAWHRDYPNTYISQATPMFMRVMVCLDGMTGENGATAFFPGSHLVSDDEAGQKSRVQDVAATQRADARPALPDRWCSFIRRSSTAADGMSRNNLGGTSSCSGVMPARRYRRKTARF